MAGIADRIREQRMLTGLTQAGLAKLIEVTPAAVSRWELSTAKPKSEMLLKISSVLRVNPKWLIYGKLDPVYGMKNDTDVNCIDVPFYINVSASAGDGCVNEGEGTLEYTPLPRGVLDTQTERDSVVCIRSKGDSMEPAFRHDSILAINTSKKDIVDGRVYVLIIDDVLRVKIVEKTHRKLILKSFNKEYKDEYIDFNSSQCDLVSVVGEVFWYSSTL